MNMDNTENIVTTNLDQTENVDQSPTKIHQRNDTDRRVDNQNSLRNINRDSDLTDFNQTIGGVSLNNQSMQFGTIKQSLPVLKLNVPLSITSNKIFEVFMNVSKQTNFEIIEMEQSIATAVNKEPFSITKMLLKCLPFQAMINNGGSTTQYKKQDMIEDNSQIIDGTLNTDMNSQRSNKSANNQIQKQKEQETQISAIRLHITVNEIKCCRKITLKGLYGDNSLLRKFIQLYRKKVIEMVHEFGGHQVQGSDIFEQTGIQNMIGATEESHDTELSSFRGRQSIGDIVTQRSGAIGGSQRGSFRGTLREQSNTSRKYVNQIRNQEYVPDDDDENEEETSAAIQESNSIYEIHKILSSDQYTIGKNVSEYIQSFHMQYKNIKESSELLPQPLESIQDLINELVRTFSMDFNLGKDQTKDMMPYCRTAIEKYLYQKISDNVQAMYQIKYQKDNQQFSDNQEKLLLGYESKYDVDARKEMMQFLGIKQKFQLQAAATNSDKSKDNQQNNDYSSTMIAQPPPLLSNNYRGNKHFLTSTGSGIDDNLVRTDSINSDVFKSVKSHQFPDQVSYQMSGHMIPYREAIRQLEKMQQCVTPREKLQCLSESYGSLKTAVVDYHKGKLELCAMDDILPLTIYVVSQAQVACIVSEFKMLEDYIKIAEQQGCKRSGSVNFELEKKILTNYNCGVIFVSKEWEPPETPMEVIDVDMKFNKHRSNQIDDEQQLNLVQPIDMTNEEEDISPENMQSTNTAATENQNSQFNQLNMKQSNYQEKNSNQNQSNLKLQERKESVKSLKNVKTVEYQLDEDDEEDPTDFDQHREDQLNM